MIRPPGPARSFAGSSVPAWSISLAEFVNGPPVACSGQKRYLAAQPRRRNKLQENGRDRERSNADRRPPRKNATSTKRLEACNDEGCEDRVGSMEWGTPSETRAPEHAGAQDEEQIPQDEDDRQRHQDSEDFEHTANDRTRWPTSDGWPAPPHGLAARSSRPNWLLMAVRSEPSGSIVTCITRPFATAISSDAMPSA